MLHAAATLIGCGLLWVMFTEHAGAPVDYVIAVAASLASFAIASRLFGAGHAYARAPQYAVLVIGRARSVVANAWATIRAAIAADVSLKPALVRVRTRAHSDISKAAFADMISATSGAVVVDADSDGLLVHVLDEDHVDAERLGRLEARVLGALEGRGPV